LLLVHPEPSQGGALGTPRDYLNRQQAAVASGIVHEVFFTTSGAVSGGPGSNAVILVFPDADDGLWCRTAGSLTGTGIENPTGATESATALPGTLLGACSAGSGPGSFDTLTIIGVDNLAPGTKYGIRIAGNGAALGSAAAANGIKVTIKTNNGTSDVDLGTINLALIANDQVAVSISASVPGTPPPPANPRVEFYGYAAPNAGVTVERGGSVIATATAPPDATFSFILTDQPEGQQSYFIHAVDVDGTLLAPVTFALNLTSGTNTVINGIFLGPSITVTPSAVTLGESVTAQGMTVPDSSVIVTVTPNGFHYTVTTDATGRWSKTLNSTEVGVGTHTAFAQATISDQVSLESASVSFSITSAAPVPGEPVPTGPTADFNLDNRVDLTDFSILLFFWHSTSSASQRIDLNGDGVVDIIDFSIMLYQWTG
jgi:hypothetical protein